MVCNLLSRNVCRGYHQTSVPLENLQPFNFPMPWKHMKCVKKENEKNSSRRDDFCGMTRKHIDFFSGSLSMMRAVSECVCVGVHVCVSEREKGGEKEKRLCVRERQRKKRQDCVQPKHVFLFRLPKILPHIQCLISQNERWAVFDVPQTDSLLLYDQWPDKHYNKQMNVHKRRRHQILCKGCTRKVNKFLGLFGIFMLPSFENARNLWL